MAKNKTGLTPAGERLHKRKHELRQFKLPRSVMVSVDLEHGLAHFTFPKKIAMFTGVNDYKYTIPDMGRKGTGVNIDINNDNKIFALEDISGEMAKVVSNWFIALNKAQKVLDRKRRKREAKARSKKLPVPRNSRSQ